MEAATKFKRLLRVMARAEQAMKIEGATEDDKKTAAELSCMADDIHLAHKQWWQDPATGEPIERNKGELIALMHSELSECLEGVRKGLMDDHLPHRTMEEVELADTMIRIFDYCGAYNLDIGGAILEKLIYNKNREDHKPENRVKEGGKKF